MIWVLLFISYCHGIPSVIQKQARSVEWGVLLEEPFIDDYWYFNEPFTPVMVPDFRIRIEVSRKNT